MIRMQLQPMNSGKMGVRIVFSCGKHSRPKDTEGRTGQYIVLWKHFPTIQNAYREQ
ncbi:hypothetical protein KSD_49790 [Ktedonobacter sp. SOSP1-85]|nr:hypothetical protein KSD_49790 [Ktedonobacter sp. SOSP1-85]